MISRLLHPFRWLLQVLSSAAYKFYWDDCFSRASSLAYTTLFALVPMTALVFALYRGFAIDEHEIQRIIQNVLPPSEGKLLQDLTAQLIQYLTEFGHNVRALSTVSLAVVVFSGVALVNTIQSALNVVWRVTSSASMVSKIITFWAVITLGPLLIAVSFYWYTRFGIFTTADPQMSTTLFKVIDFMVPIGAVWTALTLLFYKLPSANVQLRDAALGAFIGAVLFELAKRGFAYYIGVSTTYSSFYGVLVSVPVFLVWLYLVWVVVLFGAEISYQAGSIKILSGLSKYASELGEVGVLLGLRILCVIGRNFVRGHAPPSESEIALEVGTDPVLVRTCLGILSDAELITVADPQFHSRALRLAPTKITIAAVVDAFHSKRYRSRSESRTEAELMSGMAFLQILKDTSIHIDPFRAMRDWTLNDLLLEAKELDPQAPSPLEPTPTVS